MKKYFRPLPIILLVLATFILTTPVFADVQIPLVYQLDYDHVEDITIKDTQ